jgi:hypothetical protein
MKKLMMLLVLGWAAVSAGAWAQTAAASPEKKALVARVLALQQPAIENIAQALAEQPAAQMMQQANLVLQSRVPSEKREAVARQIQVELKRYLDQSVPIVREQAVKLAPSTIGALLDEKFSEEELKQLLAIIESPVNRKFQQLGGDMQKALGEKLVADTRDQVTPMARTLELAIGKTLGIEAPPASAPAAPTKAKPPAKPASK